MARLSALIVILALAAGIGVGAWVGTDGSPELKSGLEPVQAIGTLWLNGLKMTVVPLVFCLLVNGIASVAHAASSGRLAARSVMIFAVLLVTATIFACLATPLVLQLWPVSPDAVQGVITEAASKPVGAVTPPTLASWLKDLLPVNPIGSAAAAQGSGPGAGPAVLQITMFAVLFGFAATRLPRQRRETLVSLFKAVADTLIILVRWVLLAAPLGVFALSLGVGLDSGVRVFGLLAQYVTIAAGITAVIVLMAIAFAVVWGRTNPVRFLSAMAPVFATAASTQSSLATLPLMVERSVDAMGVKPQVANLTLPLAVAIFRMTSPVTNLVVAFFVAAVHGIELGPGQIIAGALVAIPVSIGSVGLPGAVSFVASVAPICAAMGVPIDLLGLLVTIEVIPDIFRTLGNVAGDMAATVIANRDKADGSAVPASSVQDIAAGGPLPATPAPPP
jgi:Na+/H+-dicarboxylate symporter